MSKKSKKIQQCDLDFKDLEIVIEDLDVDFDVDPEFITEEQCCHIAKILETMSRSISIDKTYVDFKGNHFKDSFIVESEPPSSLLSSAPFNIIFANSSGLFP